MTASQPPVPPPPLSPLDYTAEWSNGCHFIIIAVASLHACARCASGKVAREGEGSKTKTNTAEEKEYEGRKGEMIARRRDSVENASESVQFPFPMPPIPPPRIGGCSLVGRPVGWFVDSGAFTVGCVIRYGEGEKRKRISPPGQEDSSYCGSQ